METGKTHTLLQIPLHNSKLPFIVHILHDIPSQRLFVSAVNLTRFDEFGFALVDAGLVGFCVEVDDDCVDHFVLVSSSLIIFRLA